MSCRCQGCRKDYKVDVLVPDDLWRCITPRPDNIAGGLLCGPCIVTRIEALADHAAFNLTPTP